jgi:hypothetical protein
LQSSGFLLMINNHIDIILKLKEYVVDNLRREALPIMTCALSSTNMFEFCNWRNDGATGQLGVTGTLPQARRAVGHQDPVQEDQQPGLVRRQPPQEQYGA